ncbi:MAG: hypothetical protein CMF38_01930 [Legionellaceae bacterium]|nr:hypothetical protein [Legionellaceae bacterium]HAF87226.1 hypothetical protein [Legionellales bacterium]HCA89528.1 hypothetical protein [Legionellales bacterium]|tara:strand:- start:733 stop:1041 length:309 start_codon:yes stop_codon:yes gene_type:complete
MNSPAKDTFNFDPNIKTAVIYTIKETNAFLVEIHDNQESYFLKEQDDPIQYTSLVNAKAAAVNAGATKGYQALDNLYDEVGTSTEPLAQGSNRYAYLPCSLT